MATIERSEADHQARIDRLTSSLLLALGNSFTFIGALSLGQKVSSPHSKIVSDQKKLLNDAQKADEFERRKAVEASIEFIFSALKAVVGDDLLGVLATEEEGNKSDRVVAVRRVVAAIRKGMDNDPLAPPSPIAKLDDGLRALLAGETTEFLKPNKRDGKYRNVHSIRRIQYLACRLRQRLVDIESSAGKADERFHNAFKLAWDTARKWPIAMAGKISSSDIALWNSQLEAIDSTDGNTASAIEARLALLRDEYDKERDR